MDKIAQMLACAVQLTGLPPADVSMIELREMKPPAAVIERFDLPENIEGFYVLWVTGKVTIWGESFAIQVHEMVHHLLRMNGQIKHSEELPRMAEAQAWRCETGITLKLDARAKIEGEKE